MDAGRRKDIKERLRHIHNGVWRANVSGDDFYDCSVWAENEEGESVRIADKVDVPNAYFIAFAREDVPDLLLALDEADSENTRLQKELESYQFFMRRIEKLPDCNTCTKKDECAYLPKPGAFARINCPLWHGAKGVGLYEQG